MNWNEIWGTVLAIIASVGGAGAIIFAVSRFLAEKTADRLQAKYQLELNKQLESFKAEIEQKNYMQKSFFDTEFSIYRDLCVKYNSLVDAAYSLFPSGLSVGPEYNDEELFNRCNEKLQNAISKYNEAYTSLAVNAAFMPKELYDKFDLIRKKVNSQIFNYRDLNPWRMKQESSREFLEERRACFKKTSEIITEWSVLVDDLRQYLESISSKKEN